MNLSQISLSPPAPTLDFLSRLVRHAGMPDAATPNAASAEQSPATTLTPALLRAALLELGVTANAENLQLAEALTNLGLPLTAGVIAEAHVALARTPGASPLAFALAQALKLPTTPDVLRALSTVTGGIPARRAMPQDVMDWLTLALDAGMDSEALAAQLNLMVNQRGRSTERRLADAPEDARADINDTRSMLLRLAQSAGDRQVGIGADTLASHIEGQQLINLAAQREHSGPDTPPLYFALPLQFPAEQTMLELRLWNREEDPDDEWAEPEDGPSVRATVRVATTRLGRVQAELVGLLSGALECRLGAELPATVRLLQRSGEKLAASLMGLGWRHCRVTCQAQTEWKPLWHGGEALTAPRARVDWKI